MARLRSLLPWLVCLAVGACGAGRSHTSSTATAAVPGGGAVVFAHSCSACHSLVGNESEHKQGGDLLGYRMTRSQLLGFTRVMPTKPLTEAQLNAVVDYIRRAQARAR
jgi:mono/diheme cytochrome c family protein